MTQPAIFRKEVSTLPEILEPNTLYAVRTGVGFDLYISDMTGAMAYKMNPVSSDASASDIATINSVARLIQTHTIMAQMASIGQAQ